MDDGKKTRMIEKKKGWWKKKKDDGKRKIWIKDGGTNENFNDTSR